MSIREAFEKHKSLISKIEETIIPLQEQKLWNDDKFFNGVKDMLNSGNITESRTIEIISRAIFNIKQSQPDVEAVTKLVKAFPGALKCIHNTPGVRDLITIQTLFAYHHMENGKYEYQMGIFGTQYISTFALEGMKHNVGGANMRGGLLNDVYEDIFIRNSKLNMLQSLAIYYHGKKSLNALKDLRRDQILVKQDIVGQNLLFYSSFVQSDKEFEYMMSWDPDALCNTRVNDSPLLHAIVNSNATNKQKERAFERCLKFSLKFKRSILFQKDQHGKTALKLALEKLGEKLVMTMLRKILEESSGYPLLHHVLLQEPKYLNLFVKYFSNLYHLRDEHGQTLTQAMFSKKRDYLEENPMLWMNLSSDQLEEQDPHTTLRPFAAVASGDDGKLDLSFSILRKHPSVLDVIWEERVKKAIKKKGKKRNAEESSEHCKIKKKKEISILKAVEKHKNIISRIEETIAPLQKKKNLWNDDTFFNAVEDFLTDGNLCEEKLCEIVADALFNLKISQPGVEHVKKLITAFPGALKFKDSDDCLPIEYLTRYTKKENEKFKCGTKYISTLALEGLKRNVGGENMRGGLLCVSSTGSNTLQRLSRYSSGKWYLGTLKDLRRHKLLIKKDIVDFNLLYHSCIGQQSLQQFQYFIEWDTEALIKTTVNGASILHAVIQVEDEQSSKRGFKRFIKYSLPHYKHLLFLKDDKNQTALDQAIKKFGEKETFTILRDFFVEETAYLILHQVIVHQPKYYNLFLKWFPRMYYIRDENGRTPTQVMFSINRECLQENPTCWMNQSTDQLEEKDPQTTLRPFASVAYGMLGNVNLSYQILRKHPSVIDVILEQRENAVGNSNSKKRVAEEEDLDHDSKKKRDEDMDDEAN